MGSAFSCCRSSRAETRRRKHASQPLTINSFSIKHMLGEGYFSKVCCVRHKSTDKIFALKMIEKWKCIAAGQVRFAMTEVEILKLLQHDNIVKLWFTFYDSEHVCMGLECYDGGSLYYHKLHSKITAKACSIYLMEIGSALDYLRQLRLVHRDVKPDNIMLDMKGHAYLTDFNLTMRVPQGEKLYGRHGTPQYMAPEITLQRGYSYAVDWWGLGYTAYEVTQKKELVLEYCAEGTGAHVEFHYRRSVYDNCPALAAAIKENKVNVEKYIELEQQREGHASIYKKKKRLRSPNKTPDRLLESYETSVALLESSYEEYCAKGLYDNICISDESFELIVEAEIAEISTEKLRTTREPRVNEGASTSACLNTRCKNSAMDDHGLLSNSQSTTKALIHNRDPRLTPGLTRGDRHYIYDWEDIFTKQLPYTDMHHMSVPKNSLKADDRHFITDTPTFCMYDVKTPRARSCLL